MTPGRAYGLLIAFALALLAVLSAVAGYLGMPHASLETQLSGWCAPMLQRLLDSAHPVSWSERVLTLLFAMMALAAIGSTLYSLAATQGFVRRVASKRQPLTPTLQKISGELGLSGRLVHCVSEARFSFCQGLLRPRIFVSSALVAELDEGALRAVLAHELHHLRQRDPLRSLISLVLAALAFPLPVVAGLRRTYLVAREIEADHHAAKVAGNRALARALLSMMRGQPGLVLPRAAAVGAFEPQASRIDHIVKPDSARRPALDRRSIVLSMASIALLIGVIAPSLREPVHARPADRVAAPPLSVSCPMHRDCENSLECELRCDLFEETTHRCESDAHTHADAALHSH